MSTGRRMTLQLAATSRKKRHTRAHSRQSTVFRKSPPALHRTASVWSRARHSLSVATVNNAQAHIGGGALPSLVDAVCDGVPRSQQEGDEHDKQAEVQVQRDPVLPIQHEAVLSPAAARRPAERYEERHGECQRHDRRRCDGREILLELHVVPVVLHKIIVRRQGASSPVLGGEGDRSIRVSMAGS